MPLTHRESPMWATIFNRLAADYLRAKRASKTQPRFARELSALLGVEISPSSLGHYEAGRKSIPGAVLLAAQSMRKPRRSKQAA